MRRNSTYTYSWIVIIALAIFMNFAFAKSSVYLQSDTSYSRFLKSKTTRMEDFDDPDDFTGIDQARDPENTKKRKSKKSRSKSPGKIVQKISHNSPATYINDNEDIKSPRDGDGEDKI